MSDIEAMAKAIADLVEASDYVSFAEVDREVPGFKAEGLSVFELRMGGAPVWLMSAAGGDALRLLFDRRRVCVTPSSVLTYAIDGASLGDPDWQPMTLRPAVFANFVTAAGLLVQVPKANLASIRRHNNRERKAGRPHGTELSR
jgi:hypothetical protein